MKIIRTRPGHENIMANYYAVNESHFKPWSPAVPRNHHSVDAWQRRLDEREIEFENRLSVHFIGTDQAESHIIGACSLSNIARGVFQVTLPSIQDDFEYYIQAESSAGKPLVFPATAPQINQTIVVMPK